MPGAFPVTSWEERGAITFPKPLGVAQSSVRAPHWQPPRLPGCRWLRETSALKSQLCDRGMKDPSGAECWLHMHGTRVRKLHRDLREWHRFSGKSLSAPPSESSNGRQALLTAVVTASDSGMESDFLVMFSKRSE